MAETETADKTKSYHDAERDGSLERSYRADGMLYVYRDNDEHVVVSNGRDPATKWTSRVPAERTHVVSGEQLWSIPNNWEQIYRVKGETRTSHVYHIPETGVDVKIAVPSNNSLVDAWYRVVAVGTVVIEFAGEIDREAARQTLDQADESGEYDDRVIDGLRELVETEYRWEPFVEDFEESVSLWGPEALERSDGRASIVSFDGSDPWDDHYRIDDLIYDATGVDVDEDTAREVEQLLQERAVPVYPHVTVGMDSDVEADYQIQALIQAGCSPAEAIDWFYVEIAGMSQTEWAAERDCDQSTVSGNVRQARRTLKA
jgi:hypothetical protein